MTSEVGTAVADDKVPTEAVNNDDCVELSILYHVPPDKNQVVKVPAEEGTVVPGIVRSPILNVIVLDPSWIKSAEKGFDIVITLPDTVQVADN